MKSKKDIEVYDKLKIQLNELIKDFAELSKKKADGVINLFKLKFANQLLNTANDLLPKKHVPFQGFEIFDEDELPTNSDILMVLNQYKKCLSEFESENSYYNEDDYKHYWLVNGKKTEIKK